MKKIIISLFTFLCLVLCFLSSAKPAQAVTSTIEQQINITTSTVASGAINNGIVLIDTANYTGATYYFEVVASVTSGTGNVDLKYNAGTGAAPTGGSTLSIGSITATSYTRYRSGSFSPTGAQNAYIATTSSGTGLSIQAARIIIVQSTSTAITNTITQIEIGDTATTVQTSDVIQGDPKYWKYDASKYDGTIQVFFEASLNNGGGTAFASLYPAGTTCSGQVTGSQVSVTDTVAERARTTDISANLTSGTTYMVCFHTSNAANTTRLKNAKLIIQQSSGSSLTKIELQHMYINDHVSTASTTYSSQNYLGQYNPADWTSGTFSYYFEATVNTNNAAKPAYAQLYNASDSVNTIGSEISTTVTTDALVRSPAILMPSSARDMDTQIKNLSTGTTTVEGSWLIIDVTGLSVTNAQPASATYRLLNYGFGSGTASASSATYSLFGTAGETANSLLTSASFKSGNGLIYTLISNVPPVPIVTNPSNYYNKLLVVVNPVNNPSDYKYAIAMSTDNFATDIKYVQADNTLSTNFSVLNFRYFSSAGGTPNWGGANGTTIIGLNPNATYTVKVKSRQGFYTESPWGPTAQAATINPTFSYSISPNTISIGTLTPGTVGTSPTVTTTVSTNGTGGAIIYVNDNNAGLLSSTTSYTINAVTNDLTSVSEGYGIIDTTVSQTSGGPMESISPYNGSGNNVGILSTTKRILFDSTNQPVTAGQGNFQLKAKASISAKPATDYTDTLTVVSSAAF